MKKRGHTVWSGRRKKIMTLFCLSLCLTTAFHPPAQVQKMHRRKHLVDEHKSGAIRCNSFLPAPFVDQMRSWALLLVLFFLSIAPPASAENMDPVAVKAAFVLNFARFTAWPDDAFSGGNAPIELCVYGNQQTWDAFANIDGQPVGVRKIRVRLMKPTETVDKCHIMFFDHHVDRDDLIAALATVRLRPVLTVGETVDFVSLGGIVNLFSNDGRLRFEIEPSRARRGGLRISSRLLKLAIILDD